VQHGKVVCNESRLGLRVPDVTRDIICSQVLSPLLLMLLGVPLGVAEVLANFVHTVEQQLRMFKLSKLATTVLSQPSNFLEHHGRQSCSYTDI
jgi:hypothetical protein